MLKEELFDDVFNGNNASSALTPLTPEFMIGVVVLSDDLETIAPAESGRISKIFGDSVLSVCAGLGLD